MEKEASQEREQFAGRKALLGAIDILLVILIVLNVLDFFEIIGPELDYVTNVIGWVGLAYLLFQASPSRILLGRRMEDLDALLLFSYFLMVVKNLIGFAASSYQEATFLKPFFAHLIVNASLYEQVTMTVGAASVVAIALYIALRVPFGQRSVMGVLHEEGEPSGRKAPQRVIIALIVLFGFFLLVFNLIMEWLAIAIDSLLALAAVLFYSVVLVRHRISLHKAIDAVSNFGNGFYRSFITHFRERESFLLGVVGLLVLHVLTDLGNFIVPHLLGVHESLYFAFLGPGHDPVWTLFGRDLAMASGALGVVALLVVLLANIVGFVLLFLSPAFIWFALSRKEHPALPRAWIVLFWACVPAMVITPLFSIFRLGVPNMLGVDVQTRSLLATHSPVLAAGLSVLALCVGVILTARGKEARALQRLWTALAVLFIGKYVFLYFTDISAYYQEVVRGFFSVGNYFLAGVFFLFEALIVLFYAGGFFLLLVELARRPRASEKAEKKDIY
jgi:hypothetical protein